MDYSDIFYGLGIKIVELCHGIKNTHTTRENVSINTMMFLSSLVKKLIEHKIIVVPGSVFSQEKGYIRVSFATDNKNLVKAAKIFKELA